MHNTSTIHKQMHNKTISWNDNWILMFICFMGRLLPKPSSLSSSSFIIASFLIQMLRWIRVEFFIFLIAWGIFFGWWELDLPILFSLIMSQAPSCVCSSQSLLEVTTSFWYTFLAWMNPMILGGHSRWLSPLLHSPLLILLRKVVLWFERSLWSMTVWSLHSRSSHSSTSFLRSYSDLCSSLQIAWSRNQTSLSVSLGKTLVV